MKSVFQLEKYGASVPTEILAGITSFLTLSYALAINPLILQETGMPFAGVFTATAFASGLCTIILGLFANVPFGMGPGMGINAVFAQTICLKMGFTWQEALCIVCGSGIAHTFLVSGARGRAIVRQCIPESLKYASVAGIGAFCTVGGFHYSGLLRHAESTAKNVAFDISGHATTLPPLLFRFSYSKFVALLGVFVIVALLALERKNKAPYAAYSVGILVSTFVGIPLGVTSLASLYSFDSGSFAEYNSLVFAFLGDPGLLSLLSAPPPRMALALCVAAVICLLALTDSIVSVTGLGTLPVNPVFTPAELALREDQTDSRLQRALVVNSFGAPIAAALGCTPVNCYVESCLGVASRGRTGLAAVVTGTLFLLSVPLVELFNILPAEAVGSALIVCGGVILAQVQRVDWNNIEQSIPAGLAILLMVASNNFLSGLAMGLATHIIMQLVLRKKDNINPLMIGTGILLVASALFLHLAQY